MTLADLYLICFVFGFALSVLSVLGSAFHLPGLHHGHGHIHFGHGIGHGVGHGVGHGAGHAAGHGGGGGQASPFNFSTIAAFLTWFGGAGYLFTRFSSLWLGLAFVASIGVGLVGGAIVFLFLAKVLLAYDEPINAADYDMIGAFGHLSSAIRQQGTGEMSFSQAGFRRSAPARSEDGEAIEKGAEVVVTRYEKGIAYVRRWDEFNDSQEEKETL